MLVFFFVSHAVINFLYFFFEPQGMEESVQVLTKLVTSLGEAKDDTAYSEILMLFDNGILKRVEASLKEQLRAIRQSAVIRVFVTASHNHDKIYDGTCTMTPDTTLGDLQNQLHRKEWYGCNRWVIRATPVDMTDDKTRQIKFLSRSWQYQRLGAQPVETDPTIHIYCGACRVHVENERTKRLDLYDMVYPYDLHALCITHYADMDIYFQNANIDPKDKSILKHDLVRTPVARERV